MSRERKERLEEFLLAEGYRKIMLGGERFLNEAIIFVLQAKHKMPRNSFKK